MNDLTMEVADTSTTSESSAPQTPGITTKHGRELASICAVVAVSSLGFGLLATVLGPTIEISTRDWFWPALVLIFLISLFGVYEFARRGVQYSEFEKPKGTYILSVASLNTLTAAGLPVDLTSSLGKILKDAKKLSPPQESLSIADLDDRTERTWIVSLEIELGKARVKEYNDMLTKYTWRDAE